jgi:AcrR family transcriptional regulator
MSPGSRSDGDSSFSPLPTGRHGLGRQAVAEHQRARIVQAMTQLVAEAGFQKVTIAGLSKRARVTERAFYAQFDDLEACFLAAYESILERYLGSIVEAYDAPLPWDGVLRGALKAVLETTARHPGQAHLVLIDALTAGSQAVERSRRLTDAFQAQFARYAAQAPGADRVSGLVLRGLVGGVRDVVANRVATDSAEQLPPLLDPLVAWMLSYLSDAPLQLARLRATRRPAMAQSPPPPPLAGHGYPREYVRENQRRRLMDAVASISRESGYAGLRVSGIARRARVSHQTFYEHFADRHEAFLYTYQHDGKQAFTAAAEVYFAYADDWPRAVHAGLAVLLEWLAERPDHAHLGFVAFLETGADAYGIRHDGLQAFAALLAPGFEQAGDVPPIAGEAIPGGVFEIIAEEILRDRTARLPGILPLVTYITLAPFMGPQDAARIAGEKPHALNATAAREAN